MSDENRFQSLFASSFSRRGFLRLGVAAAAGTFVLAACHRGYQRKPELVNLGPVKDLLSATQHIASKKVLVFRDDNGWAALGTSCSHDGCDLTFQDDTLLCPCCRSLYRHTGEVLRGPAKQNMVWYEISYSDGNLLADTGKQVDAKTRFTTPQLEAALKKLREKLQENPNLLQDGSVPRIIRELPEKNLGNLGDAQYERNGTK